MAYRSPVPDDVAVELKRAVQRWHQLPLDRALAHATVLRALVQELADAVATADGRPAEVVPDLGPRALPDQLTVMAYDVCQLDLQGDLSLARRLVDVRRSLD
ncbi:hypothetical protein [Luteipulveratus mongoliensis]|uniref:Uncharacterized protein n=1 Tax=Luteipulveratus mongoliensis TaxID=571913 RepID=A0A0K1JH90_9MICO|nr:hypothetical protein [Luteipulveratus mongoliensis]AKU15955.1 hypothetical protein VV02_08975 [Luteipulveratus mongoliensis]